MDLVNDTRCPCSRGFTRHAGSPAPRGSTRDTGPGIQAGANSKGEESPGEHRPDDLTLAGAGVAARTDSRGEQSFEVGVPAVYRRARRTRVARGRGRRAQARTTNLSRGAGNLDPGPCVRRASGHVAAKGRRQGESTEEARSSSRRRRSNANPHGSTGPRERVRLLERGKL
jgi:hypothetical protein